MRRIGASRRSSFPSKPKRVIPTAWSPGTYGISWRPAVAEAYPDCGLLHDATPVPKPSVRLPPRIQGRPNVTRTRRRPRDPHAPACGRPHFDTYGQSILRWSIACCIRHSVPLGACSSVAKTTGDLLQKALGFRPPVTEIVTDQAPLMMWCHCPGEPSVRRPLDHVSTSGVPYATREASIDQED